MHFILISFHYFASSKLQQKVKFQQLLEVKYY